MGTRVLTTAAKSLTTCYVQDSMRARKIPARVILVVQLSGDNGTPLTQGLSILTSVRFPGAMAVRHQKKPGVYARTSKGFGWIKETVCDDFGVSATFCSGGDNNNDNNNDNDNDNNDNDNDIETDDNLVGDDDWGDDDFFGWPTFAPTSAPLCVDPRVEMRGKKDGCRKWVAKGKDKKIRKKCKKKHNGTKIFNICLETCGMVGLGECRFLQF